MPRIAAFFAIADGRILAGDMKRKQARLVRRWIEKRRAELEANWQRALHGDQLQWIEL